MIYKNTIRQIRGSLGRFLAIFAIVALGVGFFAGLRVSEEAFRKTGEEYFEELKLYDFRLVSTLGLTEQDVTEFLKLSEVEHAAGSVSSDVIIRDLDGSNGVLHTHSVISGINCLDVKAGRLPAAADECVLDARKYSEDKIGGYLELSSENSEETFSKFKYDKYKVVGIVNSPYYANFERGSSSLGAVAGFAYLTPEGYTVDYYTEIFLRLKQRHTLYSEEEKAYSEACEPVLEEKLSECAANRYEELKEELKKELLSSLLPATEESLGQGMPEVTIPDGMLPEPSVYVLGRSTNVGYLGLENDSGIVSGISKVFPVFFFIVAALVCVTTMTRMVEEQRVQNGTLKALGYSDLAIAGQYLFYSGSASFSGCVAGFFVGSRYLPMVIWEIYHIMYTIERPIVYLLDFKLFAFCTILFLIAALGATWFAAAGDLREAAAELIRPKAPQPGKRVFLERIDVIWKHLKFLHKVSIRNIFLFKKRMFMMIVGVGGCTALLLTGFGIRDSIQPIVDYQYNEIHVYDLAVSFLEPQSPEAQERFLENHATDIGNYSFAHTETMELMTNGSSDSVLLVAAKELGPTLIRLQNGSESYDWPKKDEVILDYRLARANDISIGDVVEFRDSEFHTLTLKVVGIFDNYIRDYAYICEETYETQLETELEINTAYMNLSEGTDATEAVSKLLGDDAVASVDATEDQIEMIGNMLSSLDYVILIVLVCAGALAFIVIYNLTNISIRERIREIATIKVLGFYEGETAAYVFRENLILTLISSLAGLPMGVALHRYVMAQIKIKSMYFGHRILPMSYVWAPVITFLFAVLVDIFMYFSLKKINMTESLKSID